MPELSTGDAVAEGPWPGDPGSGASRAREEHADQGGLSLRAILVRTRVLGDAWDPDGPLEDEWTPEDDHRYRILYERKDRYLGALTYEDARVAYRIGRLAARNPRLRSGAFEDAESVLAPAWEPARWARVKPYVRLGFERRRFHERLQRSRRSVERIERAWRDRERGPAEG